MEPYRDEENARALVQVREQAGELQELKKERDGLLRDNGSLQVQRDALRDEKRRPKLMYAGVSTCVLAITTLETLRGICHPVAIAYTVIILVGLYFAAQLLRQAL